MSTQQSLQVLLTYIREEVIGLLFNRYVFRTHQEVVALNSQLQGQPRGIFSSLAQVMYSLGTPVRVRTLSSSSACGLRPTPSSPVNAIAI
jgi:hypothetical protein